jgi:hypothetical protein
VRLFEQLAAARRVLSHHPLGVSSAHVDRTVEHARPLQVRPVKVRVADDNGFQAALGLDEVDGCVIEEGDEVPQDVARIGLEQDGPLADSELLPCGCRVGEAGGQLGGCEGLGGDESCSSVLKVFFCLVCSLFRLVQDCPETGTYWRGSCVALVVVYCWCFALRHSHHRCDSSLEVL